MGTPLIIGNHGPETWRNDDRTYLYAAGVTSTTSNPPYTTTR